jgi:hypothetical protein
MLNVELTPTIEGVINRNIKFLYCFLAKDSVTTGPTTSTAHILEQIVIAFADLMKGTFRKKQYWHDHFYDYFPGNKTPEFVERYIFDWLKGEPTEKFKRLKYVTGKTAPIQQALWNGYRIKEAANEFTRLINNRINPLWKVRIPSGHTIEYWNIS